jgi:hypothetical protein
MWYSVARDRYLQAVVGIQATALTGGGRTIKVTAMDDSEAHAVNSAPANLEPAGPPIKRQRSALSSHVPIRFTPEVIEAVRGLATTDGVSTSTWIRNVVIREVERRRPPVTQTTSGDFFFEVDLPGPPSVSVPLLETAR